MMKLGDIGNNQLDKIQKSNVCLWDKVGLIYSAHFTKNSGWNLDPGAFPKFPELG